MARSDLPGSLTGLVLPEQARFSVVDVELEGMVAL